ncbi:MAG: winged-helix domain-containing protein [Chitinivibrionales bacterium]
MLSDPTLNRLCQLSSAIGMLDKDRVSSTELGRFIGTAPHNIRKDLNALGGIESTKAGYITEKLDSFIRDKLGLNREIKACIAGMSDLGISILEAEKHFPDSPISIVAGFDPSINRLETLKTDLKLYPSYEMSERISEMGIAMGIIAAGPSDVEGLAQRLIDGGVKGIINLSDTALNIKKEGVFIREINFFREFMFVAARISGC